MSSMPGMVDVRKWVQEFQEAIAGHEGDLFTDMGRGRTHASAEAWAIMGRIAGVRAEVTTITPEFDTNGKLLRCTVMVDIVNADHRTITVGMGIAESREGAPWSRATYSVVGMATTRAISRAYCNHLRDAMKLAGYDGTPTDEMPGHSDAAPRRAEDSQHALATPEPRQEPTPGAATAPRASEEAAGPKSTGSQRRTFALADALRDALSGFGVEHTEFWNYQRKQYGVTSRTELTEEQWRAIANELDGLRDDRNEPVMDKVQAFAELVRGPVDEPADAPDVPWLTRDGVTLAVSALRGNPAEDVRAAWQLEARAIYAARTGAVLKRMADILAVGIDAQGFNATLSRGESKLTREATEILVRLCVETGGWDDDNMSEIHGLWTAHINGGS